MPSQETDHVFSTEVIPELGKEAPDTWRSSRSSRRAGSIKPADVQMTALEDEAVGKPGVAG